MQQFYHIHCVYSFVREKELAAVKINPTDVEIIANELEVLLQNFD